MRLLIQEYERLKGHDFELQFVYPTQEQRKQLMIVHRDVSSEERKRLVEREKGLVDFIADLEAGIVHPEDLDEELMKKLKKLLANKG